MFNSNFYPSPKEVQGLLLEGLHLSAMRVLEPSAGKGDLIEGIRSKFSGYSKNTVEAIESDLELCAILTGKGIPVIGYDFLTFRTYTEYDAIIMNPPFDNGDKHLIHAIRLAEQQISKSCKVRAILNAETIRNPYSSARKELMGLLNKYSAEIEYHEGLFKSAERSTLVETVIIKITIDPVRTRISNVYSEILDDVDSEEGSELESSLSTFVQSQELQGRVHDIKRLVNQYGFHIQLLKNRHESEKSVEYMESMLGGISSERSHLPDINEDIERVRKQYWTAILKTDEFAKKLTAHGRRQIQKQMELSSVLEITVDNIQMLLMAVMQNTQNIMLDSCLAMFEKITQHHQREFSSNIHYYSGWKTNDAFKVNKKFIVPLGGYSGTFSQGDMGVGYSKNSEVAFNQVTWEVKEYVTDLVRMLQLIDPTVESEFKAIKIGEFENETLRFKMFGKGTVHFWFKDLELLEKFNVLCGQQYNWIPQDEEINSNPEAKEFMQKEFKQYLKIKQLN